jgi:hypothetical protein
MRYAGGTIIHHISQSNAAIDPGSIGSFRAGQLADQHRKHGAPHFSSPAQRMETSRIQSSVRYIVRAQRGRSAASCALSLLSPPAARRAQLLFAGLPARTPAFANEPVAAPANEFAGPVPRHGLVSFCSSFLDVLV